MTRMSYNDGLQIGQSRHYITPGELLGHTSVEWYGAKGDGVTNDTAAIQAAINALPAAGGKVYLPKGTYKLGSGLTVTGDNVVFVGAGMDNTALVPADGVNAITFADTFQCEVSDLSIKAASMQTGGSGVQWTGDGWQNAIRRVRTSNLYNAVVVNNYLPGPTYPRANTGWIEDCIFWDTKNNVLQLDYAQGLHLRNLVLWNTTDSVRGIYINKVSGMFMDGIDIMKCGMGLLIAPDAGNAAKYITGTNIAVDTCSSYGILILASSGGIVEHVQLTNLHVQICSVGINVYGTATMRHLYFHNSRIVNNVYTGVVLDGNGATVNNVEFIGGLIADNNTANSASEQLTQGIWLRSVNNVRIIGTRIGNAVTATTGHQDYGIFNNSGGGSILVSSNDLQGNDTGAIGGVTGPITSTGDIGSGLGEINVKMFGAKGDGVTDDKPAIQAAIDAIPSVGGDMFVPTGTYLLSSDLTIPSKVNLIVSNGAKFSVASTKTLTIDGTIDAGLYQIFSGSGTVIIGGDWPTTNVREVYPQWWGAKGDGSETYAGVGSSPNTDNTAAINKAIASLIYSGGTVHLTTGFYEISGKITLNSPRVVLMGQNRRSSKLIARYGYTDDCMVEVKATTDDWIASNAIKSLYLYDYDNTQRAIKMDRCIEAELYDLAIYAATECIEMVGCYHAWVHEILIGSVGKVPTVVADRAAITLITRSGTAPASDYGNSYCYFDNIKMDSRQPFLHIQDTTSPYTIPHYMINFKNIGIELNPSQTDAWYTDRNGLTIKDCIWSNFEGILITCGANAGNYGPAMISVSETVGNEVGGLVFKGLSLGNNGASGTANFTNFISIDSAVTGSITFQDVNFIGAMRGNDIDATGSHTNLHFSWLTGRDAPRAITGGAGYYKDYSGTSTIVGFASYTTKVLSYRKVDFNKVEVYVHIIGAYSGTAVSFTLPYPNNSGVDYHLPGFSADNSGDWVAAKMIFSNTTSTVQVYPNPAGSAWTASGTRGIIYKFEYLT